MIHLRRAPGALLVFLMLTACLLLTACGGSEPVSPHFAPPDYSYLTKLRLNVATVTVNDHAADAAGPNELGPSAPVPPDQALQQMARDRLVAAGSSGSGVFTIDQASITGGEAGALDGHLAVHLDILTADGGHAGYAEAHVSRQFIPGSAVSDDGSRAELYSLVQQMMQDMNVEFEYQTRRSLKEWLVDASGAPIAGSVDQQALPPSAGGDTPAGTIPGGATSVGATPMGATPLGGATPLAPPPLSPAPPQPAGAPPPEALQPRSPQPGFLQPPTPVPPIPAPPAPEPPTPESPTPESPTPAPPVSAAPDGY